MKICIHQVWIVIERALEDVENECTTVGFVLVNSDLVLLIISLQSYRVVLV